MHGVMTWKLDQVSQILNKTLVLNAIDNNIEISDTKGFSGNYYKITEGEFSLSKPEHPLI